MRKFWKRSLSMFLAVLMVVSMLPVNALAAEADVSGGDAVAQESTVDQVVADVQALIDALPTTVASDEEAEALEAQIVAVDDAMAELTTEQSGQLDYANYLAAKGAVEEWYAVDYSVEELADSGENWYWNEDKTTLYIKDGSITHADFYVALNSLYDTNSGEYKYANAKPFLGWGSGGSQVKANSGDSIGSFNHDQNVSVGKKNYAWSLANDENFTVKHYYQISTAVAEDSPEGADISIDVATGKIVKGNTVKVTVENVEGYTASVTDSIGNVVTTLDAYAPTSSTTLTVTYISNEVKKYNVEVQTVNDGWGTATLKSESELVKGAEALVEVVTKTNTDSSKYYIESVKVGETELTKNANGYYVYTMGAADATIIVKFAKTDIHFGNEKNTSIAWNGWHSDATKLSVGQLNLLKQEIFNKLDIESLPAGATWDNVSIQYFPLKVGTLSGKSEYDTTAYDLNYVKADEEIWGIGYEYRNFGERSYNNQSTIKSGINEKIRISYNGLFVETEITLIEARQIVSIDTVTVADVAVTTSEDPILAAVEAATTISSGSVAVTPVWEKVSGILPTINSNTEEEYVYKVTVAATENNTAVEATISVNAVLAQYDIGWDTDADGVVDVITPVYYNVLPTPPAAVEKEGCSSEWPVISPATKDVDYTVKYSNDTIYKVTYVTNIENYNIATQSYNLTKNPTATISEPSVMDQANVIFDGWYSDAEFKNAYVFGQTPNADVTLYAKWVNDIHDNNVRDEDETVTVKIEGNGTIRIDGTEVKSGDDYIFDSTTDSHEIVVTPSDLVNTDGDLGYVSTCSFAKDPYVAGANTFNINLTNGQELSVKFGTHTLNASNGSVAINGYWESKWDSRVFDTLKSDTLNAAGISGDARNYTVIYKTTLGNVNLDDFGTWDAAKASFFTDINVPESGRQVNITDKTTGVSKTITMAITEARSSAGLIDYAETEAQANSYENQDALTDYINELANSTNINPNQLTVTVSTENQWPTTAGVAVQMVYTVKYADSAAYIGDEATITVWAKAKHNNCTVVADETLTAGGALSVSGTVNNDNTTVPGNSTVTITVTPNGGKVVETITVKKNGTENVAVSAISYNNKKATVTFKTDGSVTADQYVVSATYSENYLNLKADQTIVYCVDDAEHDYDLQELVFNAVYGGSSAPMTKDNTTLQFKYGRLGDLFEGWADVSEGPAINLGSLTHKFGEKGSETIRVTYEDEKYGKLQTEVTLNVFDSCYNVQIAVETKTNGADATIKTQYSSDAREYLGVTYFKQATDMTVTLTPDGGLLDALGQLYNGSYGDSMAYIKSVTVKDKAGNVVNATMTRDQGKLDLGNILQGVNPMLYNAAVTFTTVADEIYTITVEYDVLQLDKLENLADPVVMQMYQGGNDYNAEVPTAQEMIDAILGAEYAADFLATYGGAFTVEYTNALLQNEWTAVSDEALLALENEETINVRITWKETDGAKTFYPVAVTANVQLVDQRIATAIEGSVPEDAVEYVDETKLIAELKEAMGLAVVAGGSALDVDYVVTYTIEGDEENGYFADVTVSYDGSAQYMPTSENFTNVPIADIPDNATINVTIQNASVKVTNNDNKEQEQNVLGSVNTVSYTVIGNGTYNFTFTPDDDFAIDSVTVNGEVVELTYNDQVATISIMLTEKEHYEVVVETVDSKWVLDDERVYDFAYGVMDPVNKDIVDAAVVTPDEEDIDYTKVKVEYLARKEGKVPVVLPDIDLGFTQIELGSFDVDLGELWLDPNAEVVEYDLEKLVNELVTEVVGMVSRGELSATKAIDYISDKLKNLTIGAHVFGSAGDGSTEIIRISYADEKYLVDEVVTDVTIYDYRKATELVANDCNVTFGYSLADLIAVSGANVTADGAAVAGLVINTNDLYLHAKAEAQEVTLYFAGDANYQPCKVTINVIVDKAACDIDYDSQIVTYGDDYELALFISPEKMNDGTVPDIDRIEMMIGLDMHKLLDVDFDENDKEVGLGEAVAYVQLRLPQSIRELPLVGDYLQGEFTLSEFTDLINSLSDVLGIDESSIEILQQVVEAITGITDSLDIKVIIKDEDFKPTNIGVYIAGAVTVDSDFETAYTADYLIVAPAAYEATLEWDYTDDNMIMTLPAYQQIFADLMDAHVVENETMSGNLLDKANENVKYLILGVNDETSEFLTTDIYGNIKANIWTSNDAITDNGAYVQIAYMLNWGNEIFYAMPIIRSFLIVPNTLKVELVGLNGDENDELLKTYNGQPQGFDVKVTNNDGELIYSTHYQSETNKLSENGEVVVTYVGMQTNGQTYQSAEKPEHAGVYAVIATVIDKDDEDNILAVGADVAVLVIEPSKSTITVDNDVHVWDGTDYDLYDLITEVDSVNSEKTPDKTVITAMIADGGNFRVDGWNAMKGSVNVDFPKWVDELIAEYAPGVLNGSTVTELNEKFINKLPDITAKMQELGATAEMINSLNNLSGNITNALAGLPADIALTFNDGVSVSAVGAYLVTGIVTDSDHYPSVDSGVLVITPNAQEVVLKYDSDPNGNDIYTPELLKVLYMGAKAYDPVTGEEILAATAKVVNIYVGVDAYGNAVITDDVTTLKNGVYTEFSYLLDVTSMVYYAAPIARPVILTPNPADVIFVDANGAQNHDQIFTFNGKPQTMDVQIKVNGEVVVPAEDEVTINYTGVQTNGKVYETTTVAPTHAGVYVVTVTYTSYDENGKLVSFGVTAGAMAIEPAESTIEVTGGTYTYDIDNVEEYTATVKVNGIEDVYSDYILISGGAYVSGDIDQIGLDAFHGTVNVDFPRWMDEILKGNEFFDNDVTPAYLIDFIKAYRDDMVAKLPVDTLAKVGVSAEDIDAMIENVNAYIDELLAVLAKMPQDVKVSFEDDIKYTQPGYYFYYGIVTDSDRYLSTDTGLLVIEKMDLEFALEDTTVTWDGEEHFTDVFNPKDTDYAYVVIDRENNVGNIVIENDMMAIVDILENVLDKELPESLNVAELIAAINSAIAELEQTEGLTEEAVTVLNKIKELVAELPQSGTITINGANPSEVGTYECYAITYSDVYATVVSDAVLEILPVNIEVKVDDQSKVYGDADPELTYTVKYFDHEGNEIAADTLPVADSVAVTVSREAGEDVGFYDITADATLNDAVHYVLVSVTEDAQLEITPAELTITLDDQEKTYGGTDPEWTYEVAGLKNGDDESVLNIATNRESGENVGEYVITTTAANDNYTITIIDGTLTITKKEITVTANDKTKTYGDADPEFTFTVEGLVNGDTEDDLEIQMSRTKGENVGEYTISVKAAAENAVVKNYEITYVAGTLAINPAEVTITVDAQTKVYGTTDPELTYEVEGLKNEDTEVVLGIEISREAGENVGEYAITATAVNANYTITINNSTLTITKAVLIVTADNKTKVYGEEDPELTFMVNGLVNDDTEDMLDIEISREEGEDVGVYEISVADGSTENIVMGNYDITYVIGNLTITPAEATITMAAQTKAYGEEDPDEWTFNVEGLKNGEEAAVLNIVTSREAGEDVGTYKITATAENANYKITVEDGKFEITKAQIVVVVDDKIMKLNDIELPELTFSIDETNSIGKVAKDDLGVTLTTEPAKNSAGQYVVGTYPILGTADSTDNWDIISITNGILNVELGDYICWNVQTGVYYNDVSDALTLAKSGEEVEMLKNAVAQQTTRAVVFEAEETAYGKDEIVVIVGNGVTFDLNGFYVETDNLLSFGIVIDTAKDKSKEDVETGGILISNNTTEAWTQLQPENGGYIPVYDTVTGSYKFFEGGISSREYRDGTSTSVRFRFTIDFTNAEGYQILSRTEESQLKLILEMSWTGTVNFGIEYMMADDTIKGYAASAYEDVWETGANGYKMFLRVNGLDNIGSGGVITCLPTIATTPEVSDVATNMTYNIP